jgi:hypothetical protein
MKRSSQNSIILFSLFFSLSASAQELRCHSVFTPALLQTDVDATLERLADLRLQLDINQSAGNKSMAAKKLKLDFDSRYQELVLGLRGEKSELEIRKMISAKIAERQGVKETEISKERVAREKESGILTSFQFIERIHLPDDFGHLMEIQYQKATDSLLATLQAKTIAISLQDKTVRDIDQWLTNVVATKYNILALDSSRNVVRYDSWGNNKTVLLPDVQGKKSISPSGKTIAVRGSDQHITFYDVGTQQALPNKFTAWGVPPAPKQNWVKGLFAKVPNPAFYIQQISFLSDDFIWVQGNRDNSEWTYDTFAIHQISTGKTYPIKENSSVIYNEETQTFLFGKKRSVFVKLSDLSSLATNKISDLPAATEEPLLPESTGTSYNLLSDNRILVTSNDGPMTMATFRFDTLEMIDVLRMDKENAITRGGSAFDSENQRIFKGELERDQIGNQKGFIIDVWQALPDTKK